jgi:diguanylate cyclase (GGDEF)-like protein
MQDRSPVSPRIAEVTAAGRRAAARQVSLLRRTAACCSLVVTIFCVAGPGRAAGPASMADDELVTLHPEAALVRFTVAEPTFSTLPVAERCQILTQRGRAELALGRLDDVQRTVKALADLVPENPSSCPQVAALLLRAQAALRASDADPVQELALEAQRRLQPAGDYEQLQWAARILDGEAAARGEYDVAQRLIEQQVDRARAVRDDRRIAFALARLSMLHFNLGEAEKAMARAEEALRHAFLADSPSAQTEARLAQAAAAEINGDAALDFKSLNAAVATAREAQSTEMESGALTNLADYHLRHGEYAPALEISRRLLAAAEATGSSINVAPNAANVGFALLMMGRGGEGRALADRAVAIFERRGAKADLARLLAEYGDYLERAGDHANALKAYHRERALLGEIARAREVKIQRGMKTFYESERRAQDVELLNRKNALQASELYSQSLEQRYYGAVAVAALLALVVVLMLYRRMRARADELAVRNQSLAATRDVDPLTGLYNRRHFHEFMRGVVEGERRGADTSGAPQNALLLLDLDHFKRVNDRHGHAVGDAVLIEVARRMRESLRDEDQIVRWGGEEFLVYASLRPADRVHDIAARLLDAIGRCPFVVDGIEVSLSASIGYLAQPLPPDSVALSWRDAFDLTDMALYLAKGQGRNRGCGVVAMPRNEQGVVPEIGDDLAAAALAGKVDLHFLPGPANEAAPSLEPVLSVG